MKGVLRFLPWIAVLVASGVLVYSLTNPPRTVPPYNPLRYPLPQEIVGPSRVLHRDEVFLVHRLKCNDGDEPVAIIGQSDWRQINSNGSFLNGIPYRASNVPLVIAAHECNERDGTNQIPADMPYGTHILEGLDCITPELKICRAWYTQSFQVVP